MSVLRTIRGGLSKLNHLFSHKDETIVKIISSAKDISMDKFIEISVSGDLRLLSEGNNNIPTDMLTMAWESIYEEYLRVLTPSFVSDSIEKLEIERLRSKVTIVELMVKFLRIRYNQSMVDSIRNYGFDYKFNPDNEESYNKNLNRVMTGCKFWAMEIIQYDEENKAQVTTSKEGKITYSFFYDAIFELSKYSKFEVDTSKISALVFATRYASMIRYYTKNSSATK